MEFLTIFQLSLSQIGEVTADTVAMSTPHEIEYTLQFDSASIKEAEK